MSLSKILSCCAIGVSAIALASIAPDTVYAQNQPTKQAKQKKQVEKRPNIIFILTDDQRYDAMGFLDPTLDTPNMDLMARDGTYFRNAFVTTALCSPSRASIMTGRYMHNHGIADNNIQFPAGTQFFSTALQQAGYATAFFGKWHMGGHSDRKQPGFDHWVSFAGQGHYLAKEEGAAKANVLNVNGTHVEQKGYITDELNDYAMDWLKQQKSDKPFFLYLSHKAVHADFIPAERHKNDYKNADIKMPDTYADTPENYEGKPMWVKNQRNSWHGVDFPYHSELDVKEYKRNYYQTLNAVDDGIGEIINYLKKNDMLENSIVILMGDNGFMFGEHGLIDKRNAYEESMRVPMLFYGGPTAKGKVVDSIVANIDLAPTFLELAHAKSNAPFDGLSFAPMIMGKKADHWRDALLYEYYWEYNYPQTPTTFALRGDRYKLIQYHGVWDKEELYDLQNDPQETRNLVEEPDYQDILSDMREQLFAKLDLGSGRANVTFTERNGIGAVLRNRNGSKAAEFPAEWLRNPRDPDVRRHIDHEGGKKGKNKH